MTTVSVGLLNDVSEGMVPADDAVLEIFVDDNETPLVVDLSPAKGWLNKLVILQDGEGAQVTILTNFSKKKSVIWYSVALNKLVVPADTPEEPQHRVPLKGLTVDELAAG